MYNKKERTPLIRISDPQPLSASEARDWLPQKLAEAVIETISVLNSVLAAHLCELDVPGYIEIWDKGEEKSSLFAYGIEIAADKFREAGWLVENVGYRKMNADPRVCFRFLLPKEKLL